MRYDRGGGSNMLVQRGDSRLSYAIVGWLGLCRVRAVWRGMAVHIRPKHSTAYNGIGWGPTWKDGALLGMGQRLLSD